jgi:hypothetical protein
MHTDIHALSGIGTHDSSVRAVEDGSCLRTRGYCDRQIMNLTSVICRHPLKLRIRMHSLRSHGYFSLSLSLSYRTG